MQITEPMTTATDYLLTLLSLYCAIRLFQVTRLRNDNSTLLWALGFLMAALAAVAGGTFHGFAMHLSEPAGKALWNITVFLLGTGGAFMVSGTLTASIPRGSRQAKWLYSGVVMSMAALGIQQSGLTFHPRFNHNDACHGVLFLALCLLYRGARRLRDR